MQLTTRTLLAALFCLSLLAPACEKRPRAPGSAKKPDPGVSPERNADDAGATASRPGPDVQPRPAPAATCPADRRFRFDEDAWSRKLKQAKAPAEINALLQEVGLQPLVEAPGWDPGKAPQPALSLVKLEPAAFSSDEPVDRLVRVVYTGEQKGGYYTDRPVPHYQLRYGVLWSLGGGEFCRLGGSIGVNRNETERPCLGDVPKHLLLDVRLVHLVHEKRHTMLVFDQSGECGGGGMRSGKAHLYYAQPSLAGIAQIFSLKLYEGHYTSPTPPSREELGDIVALEGGYPKAIVRVERVACTAEHRRPDDDPCTPKIERIRAEYRGGVYVDGPRVTEKAEPVETLAAEDLEYVDTQGGAGWGNRCHAYLKANRFAHARAACRRGLESSPSPAVKGAILYSLAINELGAKEAGAPAGATSACDHLKASLAARPGNAPTQSKHDELGCR